MARVDSSIPALARRILTRMTRLGVAASGATDLQAEIDGWLSHLFATPPEVDELHRQVSLHARNLGAAGRPASVAVLRIQAVGEELRALDEAHGASALALMRIAADAHAVGADDRRRAAWHRALADGPVAVLGPDRVVGFVVGSMAPEVVDAILGRTLRAAAGAGCSRPILDISSAPPDDETFHRTLRGFAESPDLQRFVLTVVGARDPEATRAALARLGVDEARVRLADRLHELS